MPHGLAGDGLAFVGRVAEASAVQTAARRHLAAVDAGATLLDADLGRTNVVSLYGPAGIGKSRLAAQLAAWLSTEPALEGWPPAPRPRGGWRTLRVDLQDAWSIDTLLLRLRAMAGDVGVPLRAFDVGLAARWAVTRPEETVPASLHVDAVGPLRGVREEIQAGASLALSGLGVPGGLGAGSLLRVLDAVAARRSRTDTIAACPYLKPLLAEVLRGGSDEHAASLGLLLSWDLSFAPAIDRAGFAVFVDTYETVQHGDRHAERLLNALIWSTPSILWIALGREPLDWGTAPAGALQYRGAHVWPALAPACGAPAIHRVAPLSDDEVGAAIQAADLRVGPRTGVLDPDSQASIREGAHGLPLYLALALETAREAIAAREPLRPEMFGGPLIGMTSRILRGMAADERGALCAAALVPAFDEELASVGGAASRGAAVRLTRRSLIESTGSPPLPFRLHQAFRAAIRATPASDGGHWAENDWMQAADRLNVALRERHDALHDPEQRLAVIVAAFELAAANDLEAGWLIRAVLQDQPRTEAAARLLVGRFDVHPESWAASFERLAGLWLLPRDSRVAELRTLAEDRTTAASIRRSAYRRLAYHLRADSRHAEVERALTALRTLPGGDNGLNRYQHCLTLIHLGRFRAAQELMSQLGDPQQVVNPGGWIDRLNGELRLHHGELAAAADATQRRARLFESRASWKLAVELSVAEARVRALTNPQTPAVDRAIELAARHGMLPDLRAAWCAKALAVAGDRDAVEDAMSQARKIARQVGIPERSYAVVLAEWFDAAVRADATFFETAPDAIDVREPGSAVDDRWRRPLAWWRARALGAALPQFADVEWLQPEADVRARWVGVVDARREATGTR